MEELEICPACDAYAGEARVVHRREGSPLVRCPGCGLLYANPQPSEEELATLYACRYGDASASLRENFAEKRHARTRSLYRTVIRDILRRYPRLAPSSTEAPPRLLDFGCGPGHFLAECGDQGFDVTGVEFSRVAADYARESLGLKVLDGSEAALAEMPAGRFQIVTAWEVIEHLRRPRKTLGHLVRVLSPGGVLCLSTPDLRCWRYRLERERWFNIRNTTHLAFFPERTLVRLLEACGLKNVQRQVFWGGRPGFGGLANLAQYAARLLGVGSDLRLCAERPE